MRSRWSLTTSSSSATVESSPSGTKADLLASAGTHLRTRRPADLQIVLDGAGLASSVTSPGVVRVDADPELVGQLATEAGIPLIELRPAEAAGLEEMFLELTADTQREGAAA